MTRSFDHAMKPRQPARLGSTPCLFRNDLMETPTMKTHINNCQGAPRHFQLWPDWRSDNSERVVECVMEVKRCRRTMIFLGATRFARKCVNWLASLPLGRSLRQSGMSLSPSLQFFESSFLDGADWRST